MKEINPKKAIYKSNYSTTEQIYFIDSFFRKRNATKNTLCLLSKKYTGLKLDKFSFYFLETDSCKQNSIIPILNINIDFIYFIIQRLEDKNMQRNFKIIINNNILEIFDIFFKKKKSFLLKNQKKKKFSFYFDSRFISLFRLNRKTITEKSIFILTKDSYGIIFNRTNKNLLFLSKY